MESTEERLSAEELSAWIEDAWHDTERLRQIILASLEEGRAAEVRRASERLCEIEDDLDRGIVLHVLVLRSCGEHPRAEKMLVKHIKRRGGTADTWFALAPLASWRGDEDDVNTALDGALARDPNHADALAWGWKYQRRYYGDRWASKWLADRRENSWLAHVMLAERALERDALGEALELFDDACDIRSAPGPLLRAVRALTAGGYDAEAARLVVRRWAGACGPWPLVEAVEANLRLGRAGDAALLLGRLRGVPLSKDLYPVLMDLERRVDEACRAAGL